MTGSAEGPETGRGVEIRYRVSAEGMILEVEGDWDRFAEENAAQELVGAPPIGTDFFEHVAGVPVRALIRALMERARREGEPLECSYRCDAPDRRRFMRLRLEPDPDGSVLFRSWVEREESRQPVVLLQPTAPRGSGLLSVCAWCRRARVDGRWLELEEAVDRLGVFAGEPVPDLSHDICAQCSGEVLGGA